jgi:NADH-quinone oxidoreductase subunit H
MMTCLKYFLPIACVLLVGVGVWQLYLQPIPVVGEYTRYVLGFGTVLFLIGVLMSILRPGGVAPRALGGAWAKA